MTVAVRPAPAAASDPLEAIESVADQMDLDAERIDADELHLAVPGAWRDAGVWFTWRPELATLQMGAPLDLKAPPGKLADAARLVTMVNERLWIGHFDLWSEDHAIVFRNAVVLPESGALERGQAQQLIRGVCEALDRFFPAFNFLIWGGKTPEEALEASLFETVGSA
ncbi:MAG: YbjN domain-containing protein [Parvularculaceae bacterium]|nr:YbjN domain-containing protein [Parvularculaceae bacterium]